MDYYSQASPSYNISLSLDVVELLSADDKRTVLAGRMAQVLETSEAQVLETSEAQFRAVGSLLKVGEATVNDQLAARSSVSSAAVALLTANAKVIVSFEALATTVGMKAEEVAVVMTQDKTP